jgi:hypothetical protein
MILASIILCLAFWLLGMWLFIRLFRYAGEEK